MTTAVQPSPSQGATLPNGPASVAEFVRSAFEAGEAVFPFGGRTALDYGNPSKSSGRQLDLSGLAKIVDYTPRDMTILVEAGVRMADLKATLAGEGQQLPIDVPRAGEATLGGVIATNWNGPRRLGHGTIRDYVIGIHAVDGRGVAFKGGGRVVKNVAGYDFCKLLAGSLGTLGVITQVALKVKPQTECAAVVSADCSTLAVAEEALRRLAEIEAPPVAVDLLQGRAWDEALSDSSRFVVRVEGTEIEVNWMVDRVTGELAAAGAATPSRLNDELSNALWARQVEFSDRGAGSADDGSPLVLQFAVPPSDVVAMIVNVLASDPNCTIQAHAASGIIVARFSKFSHGDLTATLAGKLRPAATQHGGSATVIRSSLEGLTSHLVWGVRSDSVVLLERVKRKFDPKNILNPGKYVY